VYYACRGQIPYEAMRLSVVVGETNTPDFSRARFPADFF
jgi:hypothetical protein